MPAIVAIAAPIVIGVLLATLLVVNQRQRVRLQADNAVRASVASAVVHVGAAIRTQLSQAALGLGPSNETFAVADVSKSTLSLASVIEARDSGTPALDDTAQPPSIVVPAYLSGRPTGTTEARRRAITAYRLVPLSLQPGLADLAPDRGGLVVQGPTRTVLAEPGPAPSGARFFAVDLDLAGSPGWVVEGWLPSPATPGAAWLWVVGLLGVFGGISAGVAFLLCRNVASTTRQRQMERDRSLVTGLVPVVQASLDLADVVPAVWSHLVEGLALAGISLCVPSETGHRQVFAFGTPPDFSVVPLASPPEPLAAGRTFALSLTRSGRLLGVLRVVAGDALVRSDLLALTTASELLGSALANAETFAQQQALVERMRSVDEMKTVFLATASHEIRTPVTAIIGFSAVLLRQWDTMDPVQARGFMERVMSNARGLQTLTEQLLDFSKLEGGRSTSVELLDLAGTITRILAERPELTAGHELSSNLAEGCIVRGSSSAVERIVINLVENAAKYAPMGTKITAIVRADGDRVILLVDDEGPGVPDADRDRVFRPFYRSRDNSDSRTGGAGAGLAIVAEYAASMSGAVTVEQAPTGGARFTVSFPAVGVLAGGATELAGAGREGEPNVALS